MKFCILNNFYKIFNFNFKLLKFSATFRRLSGDKLDINRKVLNILGKKYQYNDFCDISFGWIFWKKKWSSKNEFSTIMVTQLYFPLTFLVDSLRVYNMKYDPFNGLSVFTRGFYGKESRFQSEFVETQTQNFWIFQWWFLDFWLSNLMILVNFFIQTKF